MRILYFAGDDDSAAAVEDVLEQAGYVPRIERVQGPDAMREALQEERWDVILAVWEGFGTTEAIGLLKQSGRDLPLIILTEPIGEERAVELVRSGASDIVLKTNLARLGPSIRREIEAARARRDVTARKRAEERIRQSEARFRALAENATMAIFVIDEQSTIEFVNPAVERIFGYSIPELLGRSLDLLMPEDQRPLHDDGMRRYLETGRRNIPWEGIELPGLTKDGRVIPLEISFGEFVREGRSYFTGIARDITERKKSEQAMRESERNFRALANSIPQLAWMADASGWIFWYNERWYGYTGTTLEEMQGWGWRKVHHPEHVNRVVERIRHAFETGEPWEDTFPLRSKTGEYRWFLSRAMPINDSEGKVVRWFGTNTDITEQLQAAEALRESEERYRLLADMIPQHIWTTDPDGYHSYFSRRWYEYTGATPEQTRGEGWLDLLHPADRERTIARWQHSLQTGEPYAIEYRFRRADGKYCWFMGQAMPLRNEAGEIVRWFGTLTDISERKRLDKEREQLLERERTARERVTTILESITDAFFTVDRGWRFTYVNREAERLLRRPREQLLGRSVWEEFPEAVGASFEREYRRVVAEQESVEFEEYFAPLEAWFEVHAYPSPEGLSVYFQDVTERKQREEALRESRERLDAIFSQAAVGMAQADLTGRFVLVNERFLKLVGRSREEVLRLRIQDVTHPDDLPRNLELFEQAVKIGRGFTMEKRYIRPDGTAVYVNNSVSVVAGRDGKPEYLLAVAEDITDRKRVEELEQSNRDLQAFAFVASHDLKEPLRKIQTFAGLLTEEYMATIDETGRHYLERIQSTVDRMRALIEDLLAYSRITREARPLVPVDLDGVVREVVADLEAQIEETGGSVAVQPLPTIDADPVQMRQLVQNLIDNALKFRRENAPPVVRVHGEVNPVEKATNGMLFRLQVEDNGIGFEEKYLDQLFTPFRRLHQQYTGTGIGLAICRRIAERHGGSITAQSRPGQGSTFTVTLPVHHVHNSTRPS